MTVLITLTTVGADSGPTYNLYSSPDGTTFTPFATGITKVALLAGYPDTVPDGTTTIRVTSIGTLCTNHIDLTVGVVPTTTTTTAAPTVYTYYFSVGRTSSLQACGETIPYDNIFYSDSIALDLTSILYTNPSLITPVNGGGQWFKDLDSEVAYQISTSPTPGEIVDFFNCVP
jgi:hypothetical protein